MPQKSIFFKSRLVHILFLILTYNCVYSQFIFKNTNIPDEISLHPYTVIADTGNQNLSIKHVIANFDTLKAKKLKGENDDLGFTTHHFWAFFKIQNATAEELHYYLETARPITDLVELYIVDTSGHIQKTISGDSMPCAKRSFNNRKTIFKINIAAHSKQKFYMHLKSDGEIIKLPMILRSADSFIKSAAKEQFIFGIFYGILLTTTIIYLFFYFALRQIAFLYYSLYVVFIGLMQFSLDGFFYQMVMPSGNWFSRHSVLIFAMTAGFLLGKYSEVFLRIKHHNKNIYFLFNVVYILAVLLILCIFFVPSALAFCYPIANVLGLLILILIVCSVVYLRCNKIPVDAFFSVGIFFLVLGFGIFILNNFGQLPNTFLIQNSSKFGIGFEIIFLSLSMANVIRNLRNEKNESNRLTLLRSEEISELKSYFLSNISHELRTPLNAIINLTESISLEVQNETIIKNCQIIKYSSHSLLSSVNDILDFSKIEKGELILENVEFNPVNVFEHLKNSSAMWASGKNLAFIFTKSEGIPALCRGDVTRLIQITNNVLSNAIKFTSEGKIILDIQASPKLDSRTLLTITISDTGIGMSDEKRDRIFESFTQDKIDNKRKYGGLGLGLYIVKTLVDMQNGTIAIKSKPGNGTICTITLEYEVVTQTEVIPEVSQNSMRDLYGTNILVVEDNAINQMVIKMITKKWLNTNVSYTNNGQEALDILQKETFDIILMDLQMPVMDGYEATIAIRNGAAGELNKNIPIIAVTADVMETTKQTVKEIGMNHYISKPLKEETLYMAIKNLMAK